MARPNRSDERREELVPAVAATFAEYGYRRTTTAMLAERCAECGLVFRREAGSQTGSMYLTALAGEFFAVLLIGLSWWLFDWSTVTFVLVLVPLTLAFTVAFLPLSQALWVGVEYATDLAGHEPWAELRE